MLAQWRSQITPAENWGVRSGMGNTITARERPGDLPCSLLGSVRERNDHVRELSQLHLAWPGSQAGTETVRANNHQASCRIYYGTTDRLLIENFGIFVISGIMPLQCIVSTEV